MEPAASELNRIREMYRQGLYRQAWDAAMEVGNPSGWESTEARLFAGRLYIHLGNQRLGCALHVRAWRGDRNDPSAVYYMSRVLLDRRGPLVAWRFLRSFDIPADTAGGIRSDLLAALATTAGILRDFTRADRFMAEAAEADPENAWVPLERAWLLEMEDRYDEALAAAREALEIRPGYRPGIQAVGRMLILLGRDREALDFLTEGAERLESGHLVRQLVELLVEQGQFGEAKRWLDRLPGLWPEPDKFHRESMAGLRSDVAYLLHDVDGAIEHSRGVDHHFYRRVRENLEAAPAGARRVLLYVPFIRQHHMTCSAATLSSLADFWSRPIDHETVAKEIVYDGARAVDEREWGIGNGFLVREFTLSWDSATALIDRGIPFTLVTAEVSTSHLQAIVGYDARRGTLLVRDPFSPSLQEFLFRETMERYEAMGPRCMALVPEDEAGKIDGVELPDAELYDGQFEIALALRGHDRERAAEVVESLRASAPDHRLTIGAEFDLASYDRDTTARLEHIDRMLAKFPESQHWKYIRLLPIWELGRRAEHLEMLSVITGAKAVQPAFFEQYAQSLFEDGGRPKEALRAIHKAIRRSHTSAPSYYILGRIQWALRDFDDALESFRFATCLDDKKEQFASRWFTAARQRGRTDKALAMLADRVERFGDKSSAPARTLAASYSELDRIPEMLAVLDRALETRPDDGDLLMYAAWEHSVRGNVERGRELLERGRGLVREPHWFRNAADIARVAGDLGESLDRIRECVALEPLNTDAHRELAQRLTELEGREAALAHLDGVLERFPHHVDLAELRNEWLEPGDPERAEAAARTFVSTHPNHPRAYRDLATVLMGMGRHDEALEALSRAADLEPMAVGLHNLRGQALAQAGRMEEAAEALREAIRLDADNRWGIERLVAILPDSVAAADALRFVRDELRRQVTDGSGLSAWRDEAHNLIDPEEVLGFLREFAERRPDLRSVPGDIVRQLRDMGRLEDAWEAVVAATERFPLVPKLWILRAEIAYLCGNFDAEIEALDHAVASRPGWCYPLRLLSDAWERGGDFERSREVCESAVARDPADAHNHGYLAEALHRLDRNEEALSSLRRAVELEPEYEWAWNMLDELARDTGEPALAVEMARTLAERRSGEAENWVRLARMLGEDGPAGERLDALARAEDLAPRNVDVHDHRAVILAEQHRFDEAAAACRPAVFGGSPPLVLRGREIWVTAERGRPEEAIVAMDALLAEDDSYEWGWGRLFRWAEALEDGERLNRAAENLVRLDPNDAVALARLGDAREEAKDLEAAFEFFDRASTLSPSYRYAGYRAMKLALELERGDAARAAVERVGPYMDPWEADALDVDCSVAEADRDRAKAAFTRIIGAAEADGWSVRAAAEALSGAGWDADVGETLQAALDGREIGRAGAAIVVTRLTGKSRWSAARAAIRGLADRDRIWRTAADAYVRAAGDTGKAGTLTGFLDENADRLREDVDLLALSIWAMASTSDFARGVEWSKGWRDRDGVSGWMLENIAHCHRAELEDEEAAAASRHALEHARDESTSPHEVWLAFDAILRGDDAEARERIARVDPRELAPVHRIPIAFTAALLELAEGGKGAAASVRRRIDRVFEDEPWARRDVLAASQHSRTVRAAWRRAKTVGSFFWMVFALFPRPR